MTRIYNRLKINQFLSFPLFDKRSLLGTRNDGHHLIVIIWKSRNRRHFPFDKPGLLGTCNDGCHGYYSRFHLFNSVNSIILKILILALLTGCAASRRVERAEVWRDSATFSFPFSFVETLPATSLQLINVKISYHS
jgi:hypothetical protein